ncbi:hypothetical protein SLEP1_g58665 [Rubroshorea leprosula]|uniref:Uncharacterized protein n=1 Tax=Rubroshorea leprosula TaxID=152421 RepID=A0AAV5MTM4_9ROSI|nr:hypothetical protein SLEP1_g58665 [Rubroshorea leprosula]
MPKKGVWSSYRLCKVRDIEFWASAMSGAWATGVVTRLIGAGAWIAGGKVDQH